MNFKLFIYYCAVCGGWAALLAWGFCFLIGAADPRQLRSAMGNAVLIGAFLGALVAAAVGFVDAVLNSVGFQRVQRTLLCAGIGLVGGLIGGGLGQALYETFGRTIGWMIVGVFIGASIGLYDIIRAATTSGDMKIPIKRTLNGVYGGLLGGFLGGIFYDILMKAVNNPEEPMKGLMPFSGLAIGLVILGLLIGSLIALAQVFLKEAWVKIDSGRRAGKEMMLAKDETVIGRAEGVDIGLYGEQGIEKQHARIVLKNNMYYLEDNGTPGGTFLNDQQISGRAALKNGDRIQVGTAVLRFGERQKK